jgi:hypothetical protein
MRELEVEHDQTRSGRVTLIGGATEIVDSVRPNKQLLRKSPTKACASSTCVLHGKSRIATRLCTSTSRRSHDQKASSPRRCAHHPHVRGSRKVLRSDWLCAGMSRRSHDRKASSRRQRAHCPHERCSRKVLRCYWLCERAETPYCRKASVIPLLRASFACALIRNPALRKSRCAHGKRPSGCFRVRDLKQLSDKSGASRCI